MKNKYRIVLYIITVLTLQFWVQLCAYPLMIWWGMPLAYFSVIGNIIWPPMLALFLLLSFILFCGTLLGFSCHSVATALNYLVDAWLYSSNLLPARATFCLPVAPIVLLAMIPLSGVLVLYGFARRPFVRLGVLFFLTIGWPLLLINISRLFPEVSVSIHSGRLLYVREADVLLDRGCALGRSAWDDRLLQRLGVTRVSSVWLGKMPKDTALLSASLRTLGVRKVLMRIPSSSVAQKHRSSLKDHLGSVDIALCDIDAELDNQLRLKTR